jgi:hypothetical protein
VDAVQVTMLVVLHSDLDGLDPEADCGGTPPLAQGPERNKAEPGRLGFIRYDRGSRGWTSLDSKRRATDYRTVGLNQAVGGPAADNQYRASRPIQSD